MSKSLNHQLLQCKDKRGRLPTPHYFIGTAGKGLVHGHLDGGQPGPVFRRPAFRRKVRAGYEERKPLVGRRQLKPRV